MNITAVNRRLDRLEQAHIKKPSAAEIIFTYDHKWTVRDDHTNYDSLAAAIDHACDTLNARTIAVDDVYFNLSNMDSKIIIPLARSLAGGMPLTEKQQANNDKIIADVEKPSQELQNIIKKYNEKVRISHALLGYYMPGGEMPDFDDD